MLQPARHADFKRPAVVVQLVGVDEETMNKKTRLGIWILLLLLAIMLASRWPTLPAMAQGSVWAQVKVASLNVREGPGTSFPAIGVLSQGDKVNVLGIHPETGWLQIEFAGGPGGKGWITGHEKYVSISGSASNIVQVVDVPAPSASGRGEGTAQAVLEQQPAEGAASGLPGKLVFQTSSGGDIYIINADGTGLRKLTTGLDPAISPDGTMVAFARWEGIPRGLFVINTDGTNERLVYGWDRAGLKSPTWSPDGKRLAFTFQTGDDTQLQIYVRYPEALKPPGGSNKILVYEGPRHPWWKVASIGSDGQEFKELMGHDFSFSPAWGTAPGDERIVYSSDRGLFITGEKPGMGNILDDWNKWRLTDYQWDRCPAWSPDGHRIAFQTKSHDHWEIVVINDDGQGRTQITRSWPLADRPVNSVSPTWSPDGQWIAYLTDQRGKWELWRMRPDGSEKQPFLEEALRDIRFEYNSVDERVVSWGK